MIYKHALGGRGLALLHPALQLTYPTFRDWCVSGTMVFWAIIAENVI